jgi:hypothetical protein
MRSWRHAVAVVVLALASVLVPWVAMAGAPPKIDGVVEASNPSGAGRMLLVVGARLTEVRSFELRTMLNVPVADLQVIHRTKTLALLALPAGQASGDYALVYRSRGPHSGMAVVRIAAEVPVPVPVPTPVPDEHNHTGTYLRLAGGDTVTGTINVSTSEQALVATSGSTTKSSGVIDCTASSGTAIAGHGDIGVLGDVDSDGDFGVYGRCSSRNQAGVFGSAEWNDSVGVYGRNFGYAGVGVEGRSSCGTGVYGVVDANVYAYCYYTGHAVAVKAVSIAGNATALLAEARGTNSTGLLVNHTGGSGDLAVFQTDETNRARIALDGTGYFNGGTVSSGADFAESVAVDAPAKEFEPGDVVAIDPASPRRFTLCRSPNSALVAGVVSTRPAVLGTVHDIDAAGRAALADEVRIGIVGIVPTKVCDEGGAIRIGDLLVSASLPGRAKKAPERPVAGTVVGKALGALAEGTGEVEVLLMQR